MNHFKDICRSSKGSAVQNIEIEDEQEEETDIQMVNINSIRLNSKHSTIMANLKTLSNKFAISVPYTVDRGSDRNIMPFYIYKNNFSRIWFA